MMKALTRSFIKRQKMYKTFISLLIASISLLSCTSEKVTLSPLYDSLSSAGGTGNVLVKNTSTKGQGTREIFYASELTNQVSTFPHFTNDALNIEVNGLKYNVKDFVYAVQACSINGKDVAMKRIEKNYRKIQKLRSFLNKDENDVINRYLVRIKSNLTNLESAAIDAKTKNKNYFSPYQQFKN